MGNDDLMKFRYILTLVLHKQSEITGVNFNQIGVKIMIKQLIDMLHLTKREKAITFSL